MSPRRLPLLAAAAGLPLLGLSAAGCGPAEEGIAYADAASTGTAEAEATPVPLPAAVTPDVAGAPPVADDPLLTAAGEEDDGFDGEFVSADPPAAAPTVDPAGYLDDGEDDDGFAGSFVPRPAADDASAPPPDPTVENGVSADGVRELELLVPDHTFDRTRDGTLRVSFDDLDLLRVLNAEPVPADVVDRFPDWLAALDGRPVTLRGFMYPTPADPVQAFILARDNQICCFGRNPKPYDLVKVRLARGEESRYIQNRPFDVVGTFHIDPQRDGDDWLRLYRIDGARVVE